MVERITTEWFCINGDEHQEIRFKQNSSESAGVLTDKFTIEYRSIKHRFPYKSFGSVYEHEWDKVIKNCELLASLLPEEEFIKEIRKIYLNRFPKTKIKIGDLEDTCPSEVAELLEKYYYKLMNDYNLKGDE
jgi:hypothetical protein